MPRLVPKRVERPSGDSDFLLHIHRLAALAAEYKAADIRAYDVRGMTLIADAFVMCSARSEPQMKAIYNALRAGMREAGVPPLNVEGSPADDWLVLDFGDIVCHVFKAKAREFYDLDGLWADAPQIPIDRDAG